MTLNCPGCGEELPAGARFCGACGGSLEAPPADVVACPLCRTEVPGGARFCGACGQPLDPDDSVPDRLGVSMPEGMVRVPLVRGRLGEAGGAREAEAEADVRCPMSEAEADVRCPMSEATSHQPPAVAEGDYVELADPDLVAEEEVGPPALPPPTGPRPLQAIEVEVDLEIEEAGGHFQLVEADTLAKRGEYEAAVVRLLEVHGLSPGDARLRDRLSALGRDLGRARAARGEAGEATPADLRKEMRRLLRLAPDVGYRESLREALAPAAAADHVARARELLADGHLAAAMTVVEQAVAVGRRVPSLRELMRDAVRALVSRAFELQQAGDAAFRKGDAASAATHWEEALELLENDRFLRARLARARRSV